MACTSGSEKKPAAPSSGWVSYQADLANNFQRLFAIYAWAASEYIADVDAFCSEPPAQVETVTALDLLNPVSLFNKLKSQAKAKKWYDWCQCKKATASCWEVKGRGGDGPNNGPGGYYYARFRASSVDVEGAKDGQAGRQWIRIDGVRTPGWDLGAFWYDISVARVSATDPVTPPYTLDGFMQGQGPNCTGGGGENDEPPTPDPPNPPEPPRWPEDVPPPPPPPPPEDNDMGCSCDEIREILQSELQQQQQPTLEEIKQLIRDKSKALSEEVALSASAGVLSTGGATGIRLSTAKASAVLSLLKQAFETGEAGVDLINSILTLFDNVNDNEDNSTIIKEIRKARDLILLNGCGVKKRVVAYANTIPSDLRAYAQSNGEDRYYNLGWFQWLGKEGVIGEKYYIEFKVNEFTCTDPEVVSYQYHWHEGVKGEVVEVPLPEKPFDDVDFPIVNW